MKEGCCEIATSAETLRHVAIAPSGAPDIAVAALPAPAYG